MFIAVAGSPSHERYASMRPSWVEQRVEAAVFRIVDQPPHHRVDDGRQRPGQDEQRANQAAPGEFLVEQKRDRTPSTTSIETETIVK